MLYVFSVCLFIIIVCVLCFLLFFIYLFYYVLCRFDNMFIYISVVVLLCLLLLGRIKQFGDTRGTLYYYRLLFLLCFIVLYYPVLLFIVFY